MTDCRRFWPLLPLAVFLCSLSLGAREDEAAGADAARADAEKSGRQYLKELAARSKGIRSLHVRFRQEKHLRLLRRPRISEGELWYSQGRLSMKVRRRGTVESHLLMRDGELRILYPELKRLETLKLGSGGGGMRAGLAIPFLTGDWESAERDYEVILGSDTNRSDTNAGGKRSGNRIVLELKPRDPSSPVKRLRMVMVDDQMREYSQEEKKGNKVRMEILFWDENREIPPERFRMEVPAGTKTVRLDLGGRASGT